MNRSINQYLLRTYLLENSWSRQLKIADGNLQPKMLRLILFKNRTTNDMELMEGIGLTAVHGFNYTRLTGISTEEKLKHLQCRMLNPMSKNKIDFESKHCLDLQLYSLKNRLLLIDQCMKSDNHLRRVYWVLNNKKTGGKEDYVHALNQYRKNMTKKCYSLLKAQNDCILSRKQINIRRHRCYTHKFLHDFSRKTWNVINTSMLNKLSNTWNPTNSTSAPPPPSPSVSNKLAPPTTRRRNLLSGTTSKMTTTTNTKILPPAMGVVIGVVGMLIGGILGGLGSGAPGFGKSDTVIPYLKKHVYEDVVADMTEEVATQVYEQVRPQLANHLIHSLSESVMESIRISLTHAIEHSIGNTVSIATTHGVKTMLTTMLPNQLYISFSPQS
jgi:hypothetical protein